MGAIFVIFLIILGCLFVATLLVVMTFTGVDIRRLGITLLQEFGAKADRNYEVVRDTNEIAKRLELKVDAIEERIVTPDPDL